MIGQPPQVSVCVWGRVSSPLLPGARTRKAHTSLGHFKTLRTSRTINWGVRWLWSRKEMRNIKFTILLVASYFSVFSRFMRFRGWALQLRLYRDRSKQSMRRMMTWRGTGKGELRDVLSEELRIWSSHFVCTDSAGAELCWVLADGRTAKVGIATRLAKQGRTILECSRKYRPVFCKLCW